MLKVESLIIIFLIPIFFIEVLPKLRVYGRFICSRALLRYLKFLKFMGKEVLTIMLEELPMLTLSIDKGVKSFTIEVLCETV